MNGCEYARCVLLIHLSLLGDSFPKKTCLLAKVANTCVHACQLYWLYCKTETQGNTTVIAYIIPIVCLAVRLEQFGKKRIELSTKIFAYIILIQPFILSWVEVASRLLFFSIEPCHYSPFGFPFPSTDVSSYLSTSIVLFIGVGSQMLCKAQGKHGMSKHMSIVL